MLVYQLTTGTGFLLALLCVGRVCVVCGGRPIHFAFFINIIFFSLVHPVMDIWNICGERYAQSCKRNFFNI